jgi:2-polyprenyl-3-methyl-5-hydroxy-6-metoxy-1,4-benzoquinol methylase
MLLAISSPNYKSLFGKERQGSGRHRDASVQAFESYYRDILAIVRPTRRDVILDAGIRGGQLTYMFARDGFQVEGFDSSEYLVSCARSRFGGGRFYVEDPVWMTHKRQRFTRIWVVEVVQDLDRFHFCSDRYRSLPRKVS